MLCAEKFCLVDVCTEFFFLVYGLCTGLLCLVGVCASPRGYEVCAQKSGG